MWLFWKPSAPFPPHDVTELTGCTALYGHATSSEAVVMARRRPVRTSNSVPVNAIHHQRRVGISLHLAQMSTRTQGWTDLERGHRKSRSL